MQWNAPEIPFLLVLSSNTSCPLAGSTKGPHILGHHFWEFGPLPL